MKSITLRHSALVALACISLSQLAVAEPIDPNIQAYFDDAIKECESQLSEWRNLWFIEVGLAVFILVLGAISAAIQNFSFHAVKVITVVCGLMISVTTGVVNMFGLEDHRSLGKSIDSVDSIVMNMKRKVTDYGRFKPEDKQVALDEFGELHKKFRKMQEPDQGPVAQHTELNVFTVAYADEDLPAWVRSAPQDKRNLYFVGVADGTDVRDVQESSKNNAIQSASRFLSEALMPNVGDKLDSVQLAAQLSNSAEVVDSHVTLDEENGVYRYYSLLRVNKSVAEAGTRLFAIKSGVAAPPSSIRAINESQRMQDDYSAKQLLQYEALLDKTSSTLSAAEYQQFAEARKLRRNDKNYGQAISMLKGVLDKKPDFYLGWYNIALAYSAAGNKTEARAAYEKAVALEPAQPLRDGTLYNSYGHFLLSQRQLCDAENNFEKAVSLDPKNPKAISNLERAQRKLQESGVSCD
jgi:tetratricopeptide (TPR) repeat protein